MRAHILFIALRCGTPEEDTDVLNFSRKTAPMGVGYDDLNTTDSDEEYGTTARRATKRQRGNEMKESEMVEQGKRIGEVIGETMQPLIAAVSGSSEREALPIVAANVSKTDLEDRKQDLW
jgi:hypothetical protein